MFGKDSQNLPRLNHCQDSILLFSGFPANRTCDLFVGIRLDQMRLWGMQTIQRSEIVRDKQISKIQCLQAPELLKSAELCGVEQLQSPPM